MCGNTGNRLGRGKSTERSKVSHSVSLPGQEFEGRRMLAIVLDESEMVHPMMLGSVFLFS